MGNEFKLISIELYNIFNYRGKHRIDFTTDRKGNVFLFDIKNGGGKTSLFLSIKWGFYGFENSVSYTKDNIKLEGRDFMNQDEHDNGRFYVRIKFQYGGEDILLQRTCDDYTCNNTELAVKKEGKALHGEEAQKFISQIIPPDYGDFFMFNGEILSDIADKQHSSTWTNAVVHLLGLRTLDELRDIVNSIQKNMDDRFYKSVSAIVGPSQIQEDIERRKKDLAKLEEDILRRRGEIKSIEDEISILEERRNALSNVDNLMNRIKKLNAKKSEIEGGIEGCKTRIGEASENSFLAFLHEDMMTILKCKESELKDIRNKLSNLKFTKSEYSNIQELIISKHLQECPVCKSILTEKQINILEKASEPIPDESKKEMADLKDIQRDLEIERSILETGLQSEPAGLIKTCRNLMALRMSLLETLKELDRQNALASKSEIDELSELTGKLIELESGLPKKKALLKRDELTKDAKTKKIEDLKREMEKSIAIGEKQKMERTRLLYASDLSTRLDTLIERVKRAKRASILSKANDVFMSITNKPDVYKGLAYEDGKSFTMHIVRKDGERVYHPSSGEKHVLAISFLVSLTLNSDCLTPMMMDTPLSRLDPEHKRNIAAVLANLDNQVLFLAQPGELDEDTRRTFMPSVAKMFESVPNADNIASIVEVDLP